MICNFHFKQIGLFVLGVWLLAGGGGFANTPDYFQIQPSFIVESGLNLNLPTDRSGGLNFASETSPVSNRADQAKSKGKAFFLSFAIPGIGEYYAGRTTRGRVFLITEAVLWSVYAGFKIYENWIEDEYRVFAATHAGANPKSKFHKYYVNLGNYDNIHDYNAAKLNYRNLDEVYPLTGQYIWQWDSDINRHDFKMMRIRADNAGYRALFTLGVILVNHLASAIDAVWVTRNIDEKVQPTERTTQYRFVTNPTQQSLQFTVSRKLNFIF